MDDLVDIFGLRNSQPVRTVVAVEKSMSQYGVTRPLTVEYKYFLNTLSKAQEKREGTLMAFLSSLCLLFFLRMIPK